MTEEAQGVQNQKVSFSLNQHTGKGERMLAGTDECEMFFTIPADQCQALLDGLEKTQERGMRYPVPSYLLYQPPLIKPMRELGERLK